MLRGGVSTWAGDASPDRTRRGGNEHLGTATVEMTRCGQFVLAGNHVVCNLMQLCGTEVCGAHSAGRWQPEETASLTSRLLFKYAVGIMKLGSQKYLVQEDLWAVSR